MRFARKQSLRKEKQAQIKSHHGSYERQNQMPPEDVAGKTAWRSCGSREPTREHGAGWSSWGGGRVGRARASRWRVRLEGGRRAREHVACLRDGGLGPAASPEARKEVQLHRSQDLGRSVTVSNSCIETDPWTRAPWQLVESERHMQGGPWAVGSERRREKEREKSLREQQGRADLRLSTSRPGPAESRAPAWH